MIYLANYESKTISTVNGITNKPVSAITFHINPPEAGLVECGDGNKVHKIYNNTYTRINVYTLCRPISNNGFAFSSWSSGLPSNSSLMFKDQTFPDFFSNVTNIFRNTFGEPIIDSEHSLNVSKYGIYTANFISLPQMIQVTSPYLSVVALLSVVLLTGDNTNFPYKKKSRKIKQKKTPHFPQKAKYLRLMLQ